MVHDGGPGNYDVIRLGNQTTLAILFHLVSGHKSRDVFISYHLDCEILTRLLYTQRIFVKLSRDKPINSN